MLRISKYIALLAIVLVSLSGCDKETESASIPKDVLLQIGDSALTRRDVVSKIPANLSSDDSISMFHSLVNQWITNQLLCDVATRNIVDMERIDRITADYRNRLIIQEYRQMMAENHSSQISEDSIAAYYEREKENFRLSRPIIKGIYIKIPEDAKQMEDLRKWVFSAKQNDIDNIEKYGLRGVMQYDYFMDTWVDWQTVTEQIPYRFGDGDSFVKSHRNFETTYNGSTYLLHIAESMKSGDIMPFEFAKTMIQEILIDENRAKYDASLLNAMFKQAVKDKKIKIGLYDPRKQNNTIFK